MKRRERTHWGSNDTYRLGRNRFETANELIDACVIRIVLAIFDRLMFMTVAIGLYRLFTLR
jgi:hypothetical protein